MTQIIPLGKQPQISEPDSSLDTDQAKVVLEMCKAIQTTSKVLLELAKALPKYDLDKVVNTLPFWDNGEFIRREQYL